MITVVSNRNCVMQWVTARTFRGVVRTLISSKTPFRLEPGSNHGSAWVEVERCHSSILRDIIKEEEDRLRDSAKVEAQCTP